jgi:AcrR family transcriptional regulator
MSIANRHEPPRRYHSPLRDEQAAETHDRILAAVVRIMAQGVAELSIPAVAREAGVSVATVYRHFSNKRRLLEALPAYFARQADLEEPFEPARSWGEFQASVLRLFTAFDRFEDVAQAAILSQIGQEARAAQLPARSELGRATIGNLAPDLADDARERVNRLALITLSTQAFRLYRSLGLSIEAAADEATWAVRAAIESERGRR